MTASPTWRCPRCALAKRVAARRASIASWMVGGGVRGGVIDRFAIPGGSGGGEEDGITTITPTRTFGAPMRLSICGLPAAKRTAKRAAVPRRGAPVACKSSPLSTSGKILKNFGQRALSDGYFTQRNLQKTTRYSRHTLKAQSEGHYGSKTDGPAAKSRRLSTPRAPQALTVRGCFTGCPSAT